MHLLTKQHGSSTTGLLTASAIFVALLVYANQYGFETQDDPVAVTDTDAAESANTANSAAEIIPIPKGIFATATFDSQEVVEQVPTQPIVDASAKSADKTPASKQTPADDILYTTTESNAAPSIDAVPAVAHMPVYPNQDYYTGYFATNPYHSGYAIYDGSAVGRANGKGRGRSNMDGDGEFNFDMSFKSRARFDADSDIDTDWEVDSANDYRIDGRHAVASQPYYGYRYYRY